MKAIYTDCEEAQVTAPVEVREFFGGEPPGDRPGMEVQLGNAATKWMDEYRQGIEVDLKKLPPGITILRFYNTW